MINIRCPNCENSIEASELNMELAIGRCLDCNRVFSLAEQVPDAKLTRDRPQVQPSRSWNEEEVGSELILSHRWLGCQALFLVFFTLVWCSFLVGWYAFAIGSGNLIMQLVPILHLAVGVFLVYVTLCSFVNTTTIRIMKGLLTIRTGPLPWKGNKDLPADEIDQLYVKARLSYSRKRGSSVSHSLCALMKSGEEVPVIASVGSPEDAVYLEQRIEDFLGIIDRPIHGEGVM